MNKVLARSPDRPLLRREAADPRAGPWPAIIARPAGMAAAPAQRGYLICSEPRSGTAFLCQLLRSTRTLGWPQEYFTSPESWPAIERDPALFERIVEHATTPNGVFGLKLFSYQWDMTRAAGWQARLPNPRFVHLERRDLLGQAISFVRARQTGQFLSWQDSRGEPRYDRKAIAHCIAFIAEGHARWRSYFARNGIEPLWLTYEDMAADPAAAVQAVARHVGIEEAIEIDLAQVDATRQRDSVSAEWRERFIAESGDIVRLPHPLGEARIWLRRLVAKAQGLAGRVKR